MSIKKVRSADLLKWVDELIGKHKVMGIQADGDRFSFGPLRAASDLRLDYDVSILPPKVFFQPGRETLLTFKKNAGYESVFDCEPFVLLGVHPYDLVAIRQMDRMFEQGNRDEHYMCRRENAVIVAVDVQNASRDTFAGHMGTAHVEAGYDVLLTRTDGDYLVEDATPKGKLLVASLTRMPDADKDALSKRAEVWKANDKKLRKHDLKAAPAQWPALLAKSYEHPVWEEKARQCFSCGSCNLPCPTCYCFDVREDVNWDMKSGTRFRVWDGCMLTDFAKVAGAHNFRKNRADRYRHRYYRKGMYVPSKLGGEISCVGCGRCITACVAKIANPVEIFNRLQEGK